VATFAFFLRALCVLLLPFPVMAAAQQPMGTVATHDALVTGGLEVHAERASLITNASVTAYDRTAPISLARGGEVLVCATSQFHLLHSGTGPALVFALDRGAFELRSPSQPQDVILTPDLRFTLATPGTLDLRMRVTPNGDTCVENSGATAPTLQIADAFSDATYHLAPGQHVLFEHGSVREVVDREKSSCGCPPTTPVELLAADASPTAKQAAAEHPFPIAVSQGLAPTQPLPQPPVGEARVQMTSTLSYGSGEPAATAQPVSVPVSTTPPPAPPGIHDIAHSIGHFFHKIFHPKS
jgi:hypothetical protein